MSYSKIMKEDYSIRISKNIFPFLFDLHSYKMIYVSIGSKYNDVSDAWYQMIPSFLRYRPPDEKNLIVILDKFRDDQEIKYHQQTLKNILSNHLENEVDDIVLFNNTEDLNNLDAIRHFITDFLSYAKKCNISPEHLMICNYISYRHIPNRNELAMTELLKLLGSFKSNEIYKSCIFQWGGYLPILDDLIYNITTLSPDQFLMYMFSPKLKKAVAESGHTKFTDYLNDILENVPNKRNVQKILGNLGNPSILHSMTTYKNIWNQHSLLDVDKLFHTYGETVFGDVR